MVTIGQTLLHYRITERLGAGGMGEVYRARDEKLDRDVAVKVLPDGALSSEEASQRFRREADALSRLSHPHIATIHDFDSVGGTDFIVMELVGGPSLADELEEKGALPEKTVLRLGSQLARGLQAAHAEGIIHRDLKPSNLHLTPDGLLKILDFGLARLPSKATSVSAPTITTGGVVAGTLAYMPPEQLRGRDLDARTDLYSAGAVLYEMATGRRPFVGSSQAELMTAILHEEPVPPGELNERISPALEALILKALDKDPELRYQTAGDLRVDLERLQHRSGSRPTDRAPRQRVAAAPARGEPGPSAWPGSGVRTPSRRERSVWTALVLILGGIAAFLAWGDLTPPRDARVVRFALHVPEELRGKNVDVSVSPDGRHLAGTPWEAAGQLWLWSFDTSGARPLPGTDGASAPFWSPDGDSIAYFQPERDQLVLRRIQPATGATRLICVVPGNAWSGGSWNEHGDIVFSGGEADGEFRIYAVSAAGGAPRLLLEPGPGENGRGYLWPKFLPDGRRFVVGMHSERPDEQGTWLTSIDHPERKRRALAGAMHSTFADTGHLLYVRDGTLLAQPFAEDLGMPRGSPLPITSPVATAPVWGDMGDYALFSASPSGVLSYVEPGVGSELVWFDRHGARLGSAGQPARYSQIQLSPDGSRVAVQIAAEEGTDLWTIDVARGVRYRVTSEPGIHGDPVWSPEGDELFFSSNVQGDATFHLYRARLDGHPPQRLAKETRLSAWSEDVSPAGDTLLFLTGGGGRNDTLWGLPLASAGTPERLMTTRAGHAMDQPQVSPDGRWVAYGADETGEWEIYLTPFRREGERVLVSSRGGRQPRWRGDGHELFYLTPEGELMAVEVSTPGERPAIGLPRALFNAGVSSPIHDQYDVTADGQRFLVITPTGESSWSLNVVLNWPLLLDR